jgi:hypothetical protein
MITKQRTLFYFVNGKPYASLEEAQKVDLIALVPKDWPMPQTQEALAESIALWLLSHSTEIVNTLTTTPRSRARKPRADKGVPRKKKAQESTPKT